MNQLFVNATHEPLRIDSVDEKLRARVGQPDESLAVQNKVGETLKTLCNHVVIPVPKTAT